MARSGSNRRQERPFHVHSIAGDSRTQLDSSAGHARCRVTYNARVRTPRNLLAVMSAENDARAPRDGDYSFRMRQPIPSYLIALAVGDLRFRSLGPRTGVYAEPQVIDRAARELSDTERMVVATERLYGPYRWGRYDILVCRPAFPSEEWKIHGLLLPRRQFWPATRVLFHSSRTSWPTLGPATSSRTRPGATSG